MDHASLRSRAARASYATPVREILGLSRSLKDGGLLAALLDVRLDELLGVLFEDGVDLVEEVVQLALEVLGVHAVLDRRIRGRLGPGAMMALRPFVNSFHVHHPLPGCIGTDGVRLNGTW